MAWLMHLLRACTAILFLLCRAEPGMGPGPEPGMGTGPEPGMGTEPGNRTKNPPCGDTYPGSSCYPSGGRPARTPGGEIVGCARPGSLALTFDEGPNGNTRPTLDILRHFGARATFFLIGANVAEDPGAVGEILAGGHQVGSLTYSYASLAGLSAQEVHDEMLAFEVAFYRATGGSLGVPAYMRYPFGESSEPARAVVVDTLGYNQTSYTFSTHDDGDPDDTYAERAPRVYLDQLGRASARLGAISQQRERVAGTVRSLPWVLQYVTTKFGGAVVFTTVAECLGDEGGAYRPARASMFGPHWPRPDLDPQSTKSGATRPSPTSYIGLIAAVWVMSV